MPKTMLLMILRLIEQKSAEGLTQFVAIRVGMIMACWLFVLFGVLIDFWSGTSTARALGERLDSHGFRRSVDKFADYMRIMLFALIFDIMGTVFLHFYIVPFMSALVALAVLIIEATSVVENSRRKKAHAAEVPEVIKQIVKTSNTKQALELFDKIKKFIGNEDKDSN